MEKRTMNQARPCAADGVAIFTRIQTNLFKHDGRITGETMKLTHFHEGGAQLHEEESERKQLPEKLPFSCANVD